MYAIKKVECETGRTMAMIGTEAFCGAEVMGVSMGCIDKRIDYRESLHKYPNYERQRNKSTKVLKYPSQPKYQSTKVPTSTKVPNYS